jgi:biopolymer transport protein ExbD
MAFSVNNGGQVGGRRSFRNTGTGTLSEINIIPLVDVVLVLLIIFMLTAHVMEFGMEVNVPTTKTQSSAAEVLPVINITKDGRLFLVDKPVNNINLMGQQIAERFGIVKAAYIRADKDTPWEVVAHVIGAVNDAKLAPRLVTRPEEVTGPRGR